MSFTKEKLATELKLSDSDSFKGRAEAESKLMRVG